ncbi:helix-turn-helix domain-containing protein [Pedobacter foliorum]|uniref:helix-turn-helix domain-containing protein n=1 Tax=Pedobacter foliorum TaxID=2739058 RepID=UPI00156695E0|nr:helix-turn-helix transcriptional regulator [Pedobacter foliorum]NRF41127.1 helix-turn-helix domain-containing protein [Pedobacter foliorum]
MEQKHQIRAEIVGKQITSLLAQSGISIVGLAQAIEMSVNHLRTIKNGKASISSKTAGKIADFFEVELGDLFSSKILKLKKWKDIKTIRAFYNANEHNPQFFLHRRGENSVAFFLNKSILPSGFLFNEKEVNEIKSFIKNEFNKDFTSKELSRQLNRLVDSGILTRQDKTGRKSIFLYKLKRLADN